MTYLVELRRSEYDAFDEVLVSLEYWSLDDAQAAVAMFEEAASVQRGIACIRLTVLRSSLTTAAIRFTPLP